jgi:adenylate cyclase
VINIPSVSRQHARVRLAGGRCLLVDAGSRYGTHLNGERVSGEARLKAGDVFQCGEALITVEQQVDASEILSEGHQLLEDSGTIVKRLDTAAALRTPSPGSAPFGLSWPAAERRKGSDRRKLSLPWSGRERRSGRDRRHSRLLRLLSEISKTLVTVQPLPQILARVIDLVFDVVPAERAFLLLRDSADQALTARVLRNRDGSEPAQPTLSRTVINHVMRERVAMLAADALYDPRLDSAGSIQAMKVRSFVCAPLWNRTEVIGVLYADNPRSKKFVAEDLDVFTALANYAAVAIAQAHTSEQLLQETKRRERLQRYHSPSVVTRILHGGTNSDASFLAQERDLSVMFCDLVAFTALAEAMEPYAVAQLLNTFLTRMADEIFEHEGTLDKFIGDAILAVFGAPFEQPDHADRAVQTALAMRRTLAEMNAAEPGSPLRMRIAINSGRTLTGDIGSPRRREFTVLGDVVNTASRIESTVAAPDQIVITRATKDKLTRPFVTHPLGMVTLRGRQGEVELFEVTG